jgi:hypothetical protein
MGSAHCFHVHTPCAVFAFDGYANWTFQAKLTAAPLDSSSPRLFGCSVAVHGDTIVVGAKHYDTAADKNNSGQAFVFLRTGAPLGGTWALQANLSAADSSINSEFGFAVDIHGDRIVVGAPKADAVGAGTDYGNGAAYVFDRSVGVWTQSQRQAAGTQQNVHDHFGTSVALSATYLVVGAPGPIKTALQFVYVFTYSASWTQLQALAQPNVPGNTSTLTKAQGFGKAVAVSGDVLLLGAPDTNYPPNPGEEWGAAYVYTKNSSNFGFTQELRGEPNPQIYTHFGSDVDIVGTDAIVGSALWPLNPGSGYYSQSGAAYTFTRPSAKWNANAFHVPPIVAPLPNTTAWGFGHSVAMDNTAGTGNPLTVLVGAPVANASAGLAFTWLGA